MDVSVWWIVMDVSVWWWSVMDVSVWCLLVERNGCVRVVPAGGA
jgi:hypothetical protein